VERGGEDTDGHESKEIRIGEIALDVEVGGLAMGEPALGIKMPADVKEGDEARVTLKGIEPVLYPGIRRDVGLPTEPDVNAIEPVEEHGKKNEGPFDERTERDGLEFAGDVVIFSGTDESSAVGPEMLGKKSSDRDDSRKGVKLSKQVA